jgi:hypothetical protein
MPILGDRIYGSTAASPLSQGIALHARVLTFYHPVTGSPMRLIAPIPRSWKEAGILLPEPPIAESLESMPERPTV